MKQDDNIQQAEWDSFIGYWLPHTSSFFLLMCTGRSSESDSPCTHNVFDGYESKHKTCSDGDSVECVCLKINRFPWLLCIRWQQQPQSSTRWFLQGQSNSFVCKTKCLSTGHRSVSMVSRCFSGWWVVVVFAANPPVCSLKVTQSSWT